MEKIIKKNETKANAIILGEYNGNKFLQITEKWRIEGEEEWKFSKKNITFNKKSIEELYKFLEENKKEIYEFLEVEV